MSSNSIPDRTAKQSASGAAGPSTPRNVMGDTGGAGADTGASGSTSD